MAKVPDSILRLVSRGFIEFSEKSFRQLFAGPYDEDDLRNAILFGKLVKKERDETGMSKYKYTIIGPAIGGDPVYCCGKIRQKVTGQTYFIVTFHGARL